MLLSSCTVGSIREFYLQTMSDVAKVRNIISEVKKPISIIDKGNHYFFTSYGDYLHTKIIKEGGNTLEFGDEGEDGLRRIDSDTITINNKNIRFSKYMFGQFYDETFLPKDREKLRIEYNKAIQVALDHKDNILEKHRAYIEQRSKNYNISLDNIFSDKN